MALSAVPLTSVVAPAATGGAAATSITVNISTATTGDVVLMVVAGYNDTLTATTFGTPAGWTEFASGDAAAGGPQAVWIGFRVKQAGDTTFTWTLAAGSGGITAIAWDLTGASLTIPIASYGGPQYNAPTAAPYRTLSSSFTALQTGELWFVIAMGAGGYATATPLVSSATPAGFVKDFDLGTSDASFIGAQVAGFRTSATQGTTAVPAYPTTFSGGGFSGTLPLWQVTLTVQSAPSTTISLADRAATVTDATSLAQSKYPATPADQASATTDTTAISITRHPAATDAAAALAEGVTIGITRHPTATDTGATPVDIPVVTVVKGTQITYGQGAPINQHTDPTFRFLFLSHLTSLAPDISSPPTANDTQT
jgi:hypothetical protein